MSPQSGFKTDPKRDATDSIRGYVYQAYQSVLAWMQLKENEILVLEGAEDFDVHSGLYVTTTQVKDVSSNLTLRSEAVIDALNNYWTHRIKNPHHDIVFRFLATAEAGQEQGSPFGSGQKGLEYWQRAASDHTDIEPLRVFLISLGLKPEVTVFIQDASADELREKLIGRIKWDLGNKPREALESIIEDKLKIHGFKLRIHSHYSCQALPSLLKKVADLLSTKGIKKLMFSEFLTCFDEATTVVIPRGEIEAMASSGSFQQLAAMREFADMTRLANGSKIGSPIPIVDDSIARTAVVSNFIELLHKHRVIFLYGSSGLGKTNLAALISHNIGGSWGWAGFRDMRPEQVKDILKCAAFEMITAGLPPFLVLDDIDLNRVTSFEKELISLVFSVTNDNGMVILTGPSRPPLQLLPKLWKSEDCEVSAPYFDETEIAEMVRAHGLYDDKSVTAWAKTIQLTTSGHPQLVHARVRNLRAKGWPLIGFNDLSKPEDVERIRSEARNRLAQEFPSENIRILAYRLSLINGLFSRETAIAVAGTPPPLSLPGEAFDALIGPWIERERENCYRVSPLLKGAANNILSTVEINAVHGSIAQSIMNCKSISPLEFGTAFFHALMAKHKEILFKLATHIVTEKSENTRFICDVLSWFTLVSLEAGQKILPDNPGIDLILRLAQFKLIAFSPELDKTIAVIERIEETLTEIKPLEYKQLSESLAYSKILNALEVPIPSSIVIRMLSRIIDINEENLSLREISDSFKKGSTDLPDLGENKPAQILFSFQGARIRDLDDLSELISSLDTLPSDKRDQLLRICNSDVNFNFANLLINRAWWNEVKDGGELDVHKAFQVFNYVLIKSREWKLPELTKACLVAMSVIQDEYGHLTQSALDILDAADEEFPNEANLINQRAKVLFHAKRDLEALPIANKALGLSGLSDVDFVFCCRSAGIAAANSGDWVEAERLFLLGAEKTKFSDVQKSMGIGLMADAAFALWTQGKQENSLLVLADVLDLLESVPISDDIRIRHLHATVRHSISWTHFNARGEHSVDLAIPMPGMCSNQNPHEGMKDHRIIDIIAAWQLLASTEKVLELDVGITERSQAVTGGKKLLHLAGYDRILALDEIFRKKDFENLITVIREMIEGLYNSKMLEEKQEDRWVIGEIPKLPDGYWENPKNWEMFYPCMLVASVISTANNPATSLPIDRWCTEISKFSVLPDDIDQFLKVLNGASPDDSLYQRAAAEIFKLRNGIVTPDTLWIASFRLLDALMHYKTWVENALENLLISRWFFATNNQRFAFSTPSWSCPEIERCCLDQSHKGFSKIAATLDIAAPYLNIRLEPSAKQRLKELSTP